MGLAIIVKNINFSSFNLGIVHPKGTPVPVTSISIVGNDVVYSTDNTSVYSVVYTPSNTTQREIVWSITSGSEYATIDQNGIVTVLNGASSNNVTIRCTSIDNSSIYDEKNISVTYYDIVLPSALYDVRSEDIVVDSTTWVNRGTLTNLHLAGVTEAVESGDSKYILMKREYDKGAAILSNDNSKGIVNELTSYTAVFDVDWDGTYSEDSYNATDSAHILGVCAKNSTSLTHRWELTVNKQSGKLLSWISDGVANAVFDYTMQTGRHKFVVTKSGSTLVLYVDGVKTSTVTQNGTPGYGDSSQFVLGGAAMTNPSYQGRNNFNGKFYNARLYDSCLTEEQIDFIFNEMN